MLLNLNSIQFEEIQKTCHRMKLKLNFSRNDFEMMWKQVESNSLETELFDAFKFKLNSIRRNSENLSSNEIKIKIKFLSK